MTVRQLEPRFVARPWGRNDLAPLFGAQSTRIGEVWFEVSDQYPLLVKFLFTSERLSVQVHPDDTFAALHENSRGKTEMWHILEADDGASIALGFLRPVSAEELELAIQDGSVVNLLNWVPVKAGDTLFAPAGTIHAIGHGVVLCEIQQNSDVTYRLYDYGRQRELHLEKGMRVAEREPFEGRREMPVTCEHFTTEVLDISSPVASDMECDYLLIPVSGSGTVAGQTFHAGQCWLVQCDAGPVELTGSPGTRVLRARCD